MYDYYDSAGKISRVSDELAFWRYQMICHRAYILTDHWIEDCDKFENQAEKELEAARVQENRERTAHAEAPRDIGS